MQEKLEHPKGKIYYTMGEVCEMFDVRPSLIRYWESEFDVLKPHRNKKGNRLFTPQDVDNIRIIYHLLKEKKMKIEVARKYIKENKKEVNRDAEIVERLMSIRAMLLQIKQEMLDGGTGEDYEDEDEYSFTAADRISPAENSVVNDPEADSDSKTEMAADPKPAPSEPVTVGVADDSTLTPGVPNEGHAEKVSTMLGDNGEFRVNGEVLTVSDIVSEEEKNGEKPPFREQMLFEVVTETAINPDALIESFIEKKYDDQTGEDEPEIDPFAALTGEPRESAQEDKPKQNVIEQTLF